VLAAPSWLVIIENWKKGITSSDEVRHNQLAAANYMLA
jgi:hypothetical protein